MKKWTEQKIIHENATWNTRAVDSLVVSSKKFFSGNSVKALRSPSARYSACSFPLVALGFIPAPEARRVCPLMRIDVGEFAVGVGRGSGHRRGVGLVSRGAVGTLRARRPALAAAAAAVICVQGGGGSPRGAAQRGAGVPQHRRSLTITHQPNPHKVVPGASISRGCWTSGARATRPIGVASIGG